MKINALSTLVIPTVILTGCFDQPDIDPAFPDGAIMIEKSDDITLAVKTAFINANDGDVIVLPEGTFEINDTLTFDGNLDGDAIELNDVTVTGYGKDKTILDFSSSAGGDGLLFQNIQGVTLTNFAVEEAANNAIKLKDVDGIIIREMRAEWKGELSEDNGAYGFYPVECSNILIEDSYVRGSADAGVYVGQSQYIVVRNNTAVENVAGIEIENSMYADVYNNIATDNTGGILVFDLPIGNDNYGSTVRVFKNEASNNNTENFANASANPAGVHIVPPGTGVIVLSTRDVEIFNNTIDGNETSGIAIADFQVAASTEEMEGYIQSGVITNGWTPTPKNINIHDNTITNTGANPRGSLVEDIILAFQQIDDGSMPDILYDGLGELLANAGLSAEYLNVMPFADDGSDNICTSNNGEATAGRLFLVDPNDANAWNLDGSGNPISPKPYPQKSQTLLECDLPRLPAATATINGVAYGCGSDDDSAACQL